MANDVTKAFEVGEHGIVFTDDNGEAKLYITFGTGNPTGTPAPVNTVYFDEVGKGYSKFGVGDNDWTGEISAIPGSGSGSGNIEGGAADTVYLTDQCFDGGGASGN